MPEPATASPEAAASPWLDGDWIKSPPDPAPPANGDQGDSVPSGERQKSTRPRYYTRVITDSLAVNRHLGAQYRGAARLFRARIGDLSASAGPVMKALVAATDKEFSKRRGNCPRDFLPNLEAKWRQLPPAGLLALDIARTRRNCTIVDTRLIPELVANPGRWGDGETEQALIVVRNIYELTRTWTRTMSVTTASLSLHSVARYLQRSAYTSDEALMRAISALAAAANTMLSNTAARQFEVQAADGLWLGEVAAYSDCHQSQGVALHVRTWISET